MKAASILTLYSGLLLGVYLAVSPAKTLTFQTRIESSVDVSLVDSTTGFNVNDNGQIVDFGNMTGGASAGFDMIVRSNDGYKITLLSANSQKMVFQGTATDKVGYSLTVNGNAVNLSAGPISPIAVHAAGTGTRATGGLLAGRGEARHPDRPGGRRHLQGYCHNQCHRQLDI